MPRPQAKTGDGAALFPQTDAEVLAQIPNGTAVTVLGDFNGWYTVRAGDLYGFASIAEVQLGVMPLGE